MLRKIVTAGISAVLLSAAGCLSPEKTTVPEWRGKTAGTAYLGDDVLWRPRENLLFHMKDGLGTGFNLRFTVRDMNTYVHAPAPVYFQVAGPDDRILVSKRLEDDGITGGSFEHQDGIYDPFADFRYRQYHRANSPGGMPPEKTRSPYLRNPEKLPFRVVNLKVPAGGKGLYRVLVTGRWDHFISMTPDRPIPTAVHPGAGSLTAVGKTLEKSWFHVPENAKDIVISVTEEELPYSAGITIRDESGKVLESVTAKGFCTFVMPKTIRKGAVYQLELSNTKPGTSLHGRGFPFVFAPDAATAKAIHGGLEIDGKGRSSLHHFTRVFNRWSDGLKKSDLEVKVSPPAEKKQFAQQKTNFTLQQVETALKMQNLNPESPEFGRLDGRFQRGPRYIDVLVAAAACSDPANPYCGNRALVNRCLLAAARLMNVMSPGYRFGDGLDMPFARPDAVKEFWDVSTRSNWYGLGLDPWHVSVPVGLDDLVRQFPPEVLASWKQAYRLWASGRRNMHVGEVSNQWGYNMRSVVHIYNWLGDEDLKEEIQRNQRLVATPNLYGRIEPDRTAFDRRLGRLDTDAGLTDAGYMPEQFGFDGEYTCEQTWLWGDIWKQFPSDYTVRWFDQFNILKTHLTMLKRDGKEQNFNTFSHTCSPTDLNFRTRYMTHKNGQPAEMIGRVTYLDLWKGKKGTVPAKPWPCLEPGDFIRNIAHKYLFVKSGRTYSILYTGPRLQPWCDWSAIVLRGSNSLDFDGPAAMGYGGYDRATKPGALSGVYIQGYGAAILGQNHTAGDSNTVWGRAAAPLFNVWRKADVNPDVFASCYAQPEISFDEKEKRYTITEKIPRVPLTVTRILLFDGEKIHVQGRITALADFEGRELNHSIPFAADDKTVSVSAAGKTAPLHVPKAIETPTRPSAPTRSIEDRRRNNPPFKADRITVKDRNGSTMRITFDKVYDFRLLTPFRYRAVASSGGSFVMTFPAKLKKGESVPFRYTIEPGDEK